MVKKLVPSYYNLVKKQVVEQNDTLSPITRYHLLKRISSHGTSEMADVLESYRWNEYMRIKPFIQPISNPLGTKENFVVQE